MDITKWNIRLATFEDLDSFYDFFSTSLSTQFPEYTDNTLLYMTQEEYSYKRMQNTLTKNTKYVYVAFDKDKIVGYLTASHVFGGVGFCEWLAVADDYHGKGIGRALLQTHEKEVLEKGGHMLHLWTSEKNISFYKKNGFVIVGEIPGNYFGADDFYMYKKLRNAEEKNYLKEFLKNKS